MEQSSLSKYVFRATSIDAMDIVIYSEKTLDPEFEGAVLALRSHAKGVLHTIKDNIYQFNVCYDLPKYSYLTQTIDRIILNYLGGGFVERWLKVYNEKPHADQYVQRRLSIEHFSGCFYLILIGYLIAFCVLILERCVHQYKKSGKKMEEFSFE